LKKVNRCSIFFPSLPMVMPSYLSAPSLYSPASSRTLLWLLTQRWYHLPVAAL